MTKAKVFVYSRRRHRLRRRRRGYDNSSPDFRHGELKIYKSFTFEMDIGKGVLAIDIYNFIRA